MNKLAVFVEGYTELVFIAKLIEEIAGENNVIIEKRQPRGGGRYKRTMKRIEATKPDTGQKYFVMILDCGGDELVKSRIREEHENLTKSGYSKIIGLRDVRPKFTHAEIPKLEINLPLYIKTSLIPVEFILAIMEIEAWFLAESTHFQKIDPAITVEAIKKALKFDPQNDDMEQRLTPADDLNNCYAIGGKSYIKGQVETIVKALDFAEVYIKFPGKFKYFKRMVGSIEEFLA